MPRTIVLTLTCINDCRRAHKHLIDETLISTGIMNGAAATIGPRSMHKPGQRILDLAERFPAIWNDPRVEPRERKWLLRLLIEHVTLTKAEVIYRRLSASSAWTHGDANLS
jgi:hypothetical protein